jgi:hypothetical protein
MKNSKFTKEQIDWLRKNANRKFNKEFCSQFNEIFNTNKNITSLRASCVYHKIYKTRNFKFKKEHIEWIKENFFLVNQTKELHKKFNTFFNTNVCEQTFIKRCVLLGLKRGYHAWKPEENLFLKENNNKYTTKGLTKKINEHFNLNLTLEQVRHKRRQLGLSIVLDGRNKDNARRLELNTITTHKHMGKEKLCIKTKDEFHKGNKNWMPLEKYLYEKENNIKLKPNEVVMFLDNNCKNMDLNNLILVDKKTAFVLNVKGYSGYGELTKTMVDIISVQNKIKEMEKNG